MSEDLRKKVEEDRVALEKAWNEGVARQEALEKQRNQINRDLTNLREQMLIIK